MIDKDTIIQKGMPISKNFLVDHVSTGAFHHTFGKFIPIFTPFLTPGMKNGLPDWQSARNLQLGSENILERLIIGFGKDLILRSGFQPGNLGKVIDIQIEGFENNIFGAANDIMKLANRARSLDFNYGDTSFARISFDENSVKTNVIEKIQSIDSINNIVETGLTTIRGII